MVISSVVIGLLMIALGSTVSEIQSRDFSTSYDEFQVEMVKRQAEEVDLSSSSERMDFRETVSSIPGYSSDATYWKKQKCFNVTMEGPDISLKFHAPDC